MKGPHQINQILKQEITQNYSKNSTECNYSHGKKILDHPCFLQFLIILKPGTTKGTLFWTNIMITTKIAHKSLI